MDVVVAILEEYMVFGRTAEAVSRLTHSIPVRPPKYVVATSSDVVDVPVIFFCAEGSRATNAPSKNEILLCLKILSS